MKVINKIEEIRLFCENQKKQGKTIGLVPTMGFLHEGHKSLILKAKSQNDIVIVSVFVNPIQFNVQNDFNFYPKDLSSDINVCESAGADLIFSPEAKEMYPTENLAYVDINKLGDRLCGSKREGHFRGVCTVVSKLFNIINPDKSYFGEKDAQQLAIINKMRDDLNFKSEIISCPTVRESDGLAMSSRNAKLSKEERNIAPIIYKSLSKSLDLIENGENNPDIITQFIISEINKEPLAKVEYVEIVNLYDLSPIEKIDCPVLIATAVFVGNIRLIDNVRLKNI